MNKKGFTLIELLAVIVILAVILTISIPNLISAYKKSKLQSEEIFIERLSQSIDSYIKLNGNEIEFLQNGTGTKVERESTYNVNIFKGTKTIQDVINSQLISSNGYVNAGNKEVPCNTLAEIEVYKDSDYVYCFKIKSDSLTCLTEEYQSSITGDYVIDTCTWSR